METTDAIEVQLDEKGICRLCRDFDAAWEIRKHHRNEAALAEQIDLIKQAGRGKPYDVILGLSGGVDSSYLVLLCHERNLRPLLVHFDNGWNSELAIDNINRIIGKTGFDLHTFVMDWDEFREMQLAYLRASVVDIEVLTDHAIFTVMYEVALKFKIPSVLSGVNLETESFLPFSWIYLKEDEANIRDICRQYCRVPIRQYPFMGDRVNRNLARQKIRRYDLLDFMSYHSGEVKQRLLEAFGWRDYGGKHYESIFTRFYQGYLLPEKFGIDKRKAHLSNLICSGQMTREKALEILKTPSYPGTLMEQDKEFVLKKLGLDATEFEQIMALPIRRHTEFWSNRSLFYRVRPLRPLYRPWLRYKRWRRGG